MRTSITLPEDLVRGLVVEAAKRGTTTDALAAEIIAARVEPRKHRLSFTGMRVSSSGRQAGEDEEMLAEGFGRDFRG